MERRSNGKGTLILRNGIYSIRYSVNGKIKTKTLKTTDRRKAEQRAKDLLDPAIQARDKADVIRAKAEAHRLYTMTNFSLSKVWKEFKKLTPGDERPNSSKGTMGNYKCHWKQFLSWLNSKYPAISTLSDDITLDIAKEYRDYLNSLKLADATFNYKLGTLKMIFRCLQDKADLDFNVWDKISRKKRPVRETKETFTFQQAVNLLEVFNKENKFMHKQELETLFFIGIYTGLRLVDCVNLKWSNIKKMPAGLAIKCTPVKTKQFNKQITASIVEPLENRLNDIEKTNNYILPKIAERYTHNPTGVRKDCIKVFKLAGYQTSRDSNTQRRRSAYGFHSLRHALFSYLCSRGATMDILKEWSGDSERTLSKYYLHANQNDLVQIGKEKLQIGEENSRQILLKLVKEMDEEEAEETINSIIKNRNKKANIE